MQSNGSKDHFFCIFFSFYLSCEDNDPDKFPRLWNICRLLFPVVVQRCRAKWGIGGIKLHCHSVEGPQTGIKKEIRKIRRKLNDCICCKFKEYWGQNLGLPLSNLLDCHRNLLWGLVLSVKQSLCGSNRQCPI